jgi:23S rRNA pseudouridine2605 synthase
MSIIRLNKYLAETGIASRRGAEQFILDGQITVNGELVTEMGTKVDPDKDVVKLNNKIIKPQTEKRVIALNKPIGYVCSNRKFEGDKTVFDLVKTKERLFCVGRLDKNSSGLILLTNDGDLALKLTHPRYEKRKEYLVTVSQPATDDFLEQLSRGVMLEDGQTASADITRLSQSSFSITLKEGKKRQIRHMCRVLGFHVRNLHRVSVNNFNIDRIKEGEYRDLSEKEIQKLNG